MILTRTPSRGQRHDYNIKLTKDEVIALSRLELLDKFMDLIEREADRLESRDQ